MDKLDQYKEALRFGEVLAIMTALGYWGFMTGSSTTVRWLLGIGAPLLAAVVWGAWLTPKAPWRLQGAAALLVELLLFGLAFVALYSAGEKEWALKFGAVYALTYILVFAGKR